MWLLTGSLVCRCAGASSARADVAACCVLAAISPSCANTTFEMACDPPPTAGVKAAPPTEELFAELKPGWGEEWPDLV